MGIKLDFDFDRNVQTPTFVLATRNGTKIGQISNITGVRLKGAMKDPECTFTVNKYDGNEVIPYWDDITDFKLCWCKEMDMWFEIKIDVSVSDDVTKQVSLQRLGEAELLQIKVYGMEINTEEDILRDDYVQPTVFYNENKTTASLLHRMLEKAPHYRIRHIDEHLKGIQKIFSFNDKPIKECFDEIEESMDIIFIYESKSTENGIPDRTIDVYDLKSYCKICGARGSFVDKCLNCGSTNITDGYGTDTTIMVSRQALGNEINIKVNADEVKNCYRLEGGDDLMTATIRNCNPNGTSYIWDFAEVTKRDMDTTLVEKIENYKNEYVYYKDSYVSNLSSFPVVKYNTLADKYNPTSEDLKVTKLTNIVGYAPIMQHYYDTVDFIIYLESGLLPNIILQDTDAQVEAAKLTSSVLSPVAIVSNKYKTLANVSTSVLNAAKIVSDPRYQIKINQSALNGNTWTGNFTVTNYGDERDTCVSSIINVTVNDDYEKYINQKLKKTLHNASKGKFGSITQMIDMSADTFQAELKKYNLTALSSFNTCFTECVNILSEQEIDQPSSELYNSVYMPIYNKIGYIQSEVAIRENEINLIKSVQGKLLILKQLINDKLNLETYFGTQNWLDFCAYRREETYSNENYISDYLNNKELFARAEEFMEMAEYEISKTANYKHEISSTLRNLLVIKEFEKLLSYFECGNWIRTIDDDGNIYKLRLIDYEINFDNIEDISVTFSDVVRTIDGLEPVKEILIKSSDIINNYNSAMNKTNGNFEYINDSMKDILIDSNFSYDLIYDSSYELKDVLIGVNSETITMIEAENGLLRTYIGQIDNDLQGKIDYANTQIQQTAQAVVIEANRASSMEEELTSRISTVAGEVSIKVSKGDLVSEINASPDALIFNTPGKIIISGGNFNLDASGNVSMTGTINATGGVIGGIDISQGYLGTYGGVLISSSDIESPLLFCDNIESCYNSDITLTADNFKIYGNLLINGTNIMSVIPNNTNQIYGDFRTGANGAYVALANSTGNKYLATTEWVINYINNKLGN